MGSASAFEEEEANRWREVDLACIRFESLMLC